MKTKSAPAAATPAVKTVRVALLGAGTVGGELAAMISRIGEVPSRGQRLRLEVTQALVRNVSKKRTGISASAVVSDAGSLDFDDVDVVCEALGGLEPARTLALRALRAGKPFVTANKTLISHHGEELAEAAREAGVAIRFEASVGAVTPCIRVLRDTLKGASIRRIHGILNGTSHFILNQIRNPGISLETAVAMAQQKGFAEADPSADIDGHDAAQKLAILAWCVSGTLIDPKKIPRVELPTLSPETVLAAAHIGFTVKPLASLGWTKKGVASTWIAPAAVPSSSPLATTVGAEASVVVTSREAGTIFLSAPGAGGGPTASAMFDDLVDVAAGCDPQVHCGHASRIDAGGADDPHEWLVHVPRSARMDGAKLARHLSACDAKLFRFEDLVASGWIAHASGIPYKLEFTKPLTDAGACVLEVVR